jgi:hypothetical protein
VTARRSTGGGEQAADLRVLERFNGFAVRTGKRDFQDLTSNEITRFARTLENEYADQELLRAAARRLIDELGEDLNKREDK